MHSQDKAERLGNALTYQEVPHLLYNTPRLTFSALQTEPLFLISNCIEMTWRDPPRHATR